MREGPFSQDFNGKKNPSNFSQAEFHSKYFRLLWLKNKRYTSELIGPEAFADAHLRLAMKQIFTAAPSLLLAKILRSQM